MSTVTQPLKYIWTAIFEDGNVIEQPEDDRSIKHDESAEHNPSAFRDILDYPEEVVIFSLRDRDNYIHEVSLTSGKFVVGEHGMSEPRYFSLEETLLTDRKLIYFREVRKEFIDGVEQPAYINRYCFGYEGKDAEGKVHKKVIWLT